LIHVDQSELSGGVRSVQFLPRRDGKVFDATLSSNLFLTLLPAALNRCRRLRFAGSGSSIESASVIVGLTGVVTLGGGVLTRGAAGRITGDLSSGTAGHKSRIS